MSDRKYDEFGHRGFTSFDGLSVVGTASAVTAIAGGTIALPFAAKVVSARSLSTTGGTAAGPTLLLQKSAAGTGTWTSFGTCALGTDADGAIGTFTVTETSFAAGDAFRTAIAAGTAASTHTANLTVGFEELYN